MPERAGRHVEPRQPGHVRVTLQPGVRAIEGQQLLDREVPAQGHRRVQPDGRVALGQDEAVAVRPAGLVRADPELREVERGEHVGGGQRSAKVPRLGVVDGPHQLDPDPAGHLPQVLEVDLRGGRVGAGLAHEASFCSYEPGDDGRREQAQQLERLGAVSLGGVERAGGDVDHHARPDLGDAVRRHDPAAAGGAVDGLLLGGVDVALGLRAGRIDRDPQRHQLRDAVPGSEVRVPDASGERDLLGVVAGHARDHRSTSTA